MSEPRNLAAEHRQHLSDLDTLLDGMVETFKAQHTCDDASCGIGLLYSVEAIELFLLHRLGAFLETLPPEKRTPGAVQAMHMTLDRAITRWRASLDRSLS